MRVGASSAPIPPPRDPRRCGVHVRIVRAAQTSAPARHSAQRANGRAWWRQGGVGGRMGAGAMDLGEALRALDLPRFASEADVKVAYKKLAVKSHPDKGGSAEQFDRGARAHSSQAVAAGAWHPRVQCTRWSYCAH